MYLEDDKLSNYDFNNIIKHNKTQTGVVITFKVSKIMTLDEIAKELCIYKHISLSVDKGTFELRTPLSGVKECLTFLKIIYYKVYNLDSIIEDSVKIHSVVDVPWGSDPIKLLSFFNKTNEVVYLLREGKLYNKLIRILTKLSNSSLYIGQGNIDSVSDYFSDLFKFNIKDNKIKFFENDGRLLVESVLEDNITLKNAYKKIAMNLEKVISSSERSSLIKNYEDFLVGILEDSELFLSEVIENSINKKVLTY